jgi:hypothetical protein
MRHRFSSSSLSSTRSNVIDWEFTRGRDRLSCRVERDPVSGMFAVVVVTYRDLQRASLETFHACAQALRRHAALAADLRESGWTLAAYTS